MSNLSLWILSGTKSPPNDRFITPRSHFLSEGTNGPIGFYDLCNCFKMIATRWELKVAGWNMHDSPPRFTAKKIIEVNGGCPVHTFDCRYLYKVKINVPLWVDCFNVF